MAITLEKGQRIGIGLSKVSVGLGWDPNEGTGFDFDLDASAFMLGSNKKIPNDNYFIFYNNPKSPDGAVESTGDDTTGGNSDGGDDETLNVDLQKVDPSIQESKKLTLLFRRFCLLLQFIRQTKGNRILGRLETLTSASTIQSPTKK